MNRKTRRQVLRALFGIPGLYSLLVFITARRVIVRGWSMTPTLVPGERVLFDRIAYQAGPPRIGDIVLARHPARPGVRMIKRVAEQERDGYVLLGDNSEASTDSRRLGLFRREDILALAWAVYWPAERFRLIKRP